MKNLPDEQKQVVHELLRDLDASLAEVRATVDQSTEALGMCQMLVAAHLAGIDEGRLIQAFEGGASGCGRRWKRSGCAA
jgi:hypothetical protein